MYTITIVNHAGEWHQEHFRSPEPVITIGRNETNRIVLHEDFVTGDHGRLLFHAGQFLYQDLRSSNGTWISANGITRKLSQSDVKIQLPPVSVLKIGRSGDIGHQVMLLIESDSKGKAWESYALPDSPVTISSEAASEITLSDIPSGLRVSMVKSGSSCLIRPESPLAFLKVNGQRILQEAVLQDNDLIELNGQLLIYTRGRVLFRSSPVGLSLRGFHITKKVKSRFGKTKKILDDVCVSIEPNQFTAIVGGSGAGKTTLMNALSGFEPEYEGDSQAGGMSLKEDFDSMKHLIGFVPQQDILYENLTLKKMLTNAARLRMDPKTTARERSERVVRVLEMVDLKEHAHTVISKLSGGQKKRASIAVELLADPRLFFLDEPSSGLDPGTEKSLMIMLNRLAREQNKTIVMVTHNIANLDLCDQVIFMERGGRLAFEGPSGSAREYFSKPDLTDVYLELNEDRDGSWARRFKSIQPEVRHDQPNPALCRPPKRDSYFRQLGIFLDRYLSVLFRDPKRLAMLLLQPLLIALLLAMVSSEDTFEVFNSTQSMMFSLSCSAIWIGLFNTIQEICKERVIVKREYMSKLKLLPYLSAKFLISMALGLVQAMILGGVYLSTQSSLPEGLLSSSIYMETIFALWLTIIASEALGFVVSSLAKTGDKAMTYAPFLLIVQLIFSGILFKLKGAGDLISKLTISKWSVQALGVITDLNALPTAFEKDYPNLDISREIQDVYEHTLANLRYDWMILILMTAVCLGLTVVLLRRIKKDRR